MDSAPSEPGAPLRRSYPLAIPLLVACAMFMQNIDSSLIATALPKIAESLHEDPVRLNLAITAYLLSLAIFIPISGWMSDRFGAKQIFRIAMLVFAVGSTLSGFAHALPELVASRIVQGIGGAMMVPVGRAVLLRAVPKNELLRVMTFLTMPALLGPVLGPLLSGLIVTYLSWRWIFFVNLPIGIIGAFLISIMIEEIKEENVEKLDVKGFALAGLGLAGVMFGFETAGRGNLPVWVTATMLVIGAVLVYAYVRHARSASAPIIDLKLLNIHTFRVAVMAGSLFRIAAGAVPFLLPVMLQVGFGLSPLASGTITFATAIGALSLRPVASPIVRRFGFRRLLLICAVVNFCFFLAFGLFTPSTPHAVMFAILLFGGFFRSLQLTSMNTMGYSDIPQSRMSRASSFASMGQQLSQSIGVGVGALVLHLTLVSRQGATLGADDFWPAFVTVGCMSLTSVLFYRRLSREAGAEVSGHRIRGARVAQPAEDQAPVT
jgi:EmrB/QacA subfamily drug resistance transporter